MEIMKDPNVSIVIPGCNAKCDFCFGRYTRDISPGWVPQLRKNLDALPPDFWQISITGGEPLHTPNLLMIVLGMIDKDRWTKVVLTTNGLNMPYQMVRMMEGIVDHVNISRHETYPEINAEIFGVRAVPGDLDLFNYIQLYNAMGIDVTLNCVLGASPRKQDKEWVEAYIRWAHVVGASAVCFRKKQEEGCTLDPTDTEDIFSLHKPIAESSCPVCRSKTQLINGMRVIWKAALHDPGAYLDDQLYELIWQSSAEFTLDWEGNRPLIPELIKSGDLQLELEMPKMITKSRPKPDKREGTCDYGPASRC